MALDPAAGKAYWAHFEDDKIRRADLDDGDAIEDVVTEPNGSEPCGMAIDPVRRQDLLGELRHRPDPRRGPRPGDQRCQQPGDRPAGPDGRGDRPRAGQPRRRQDLLDQRRLEHDPVRGPRPRHRRRAADLGQRPANGLNAPLGLAIDPVAGDPSAGRVYVANLNSNQILVMDLDPGTNDVAEVASGQNGPAGVAIDPVAGNPSAGRVYWANFLGGTLTRADLAPGNGDIPQNL